MDNPSVDLLRRLRSFDTLPSEDVDDSEDMTRASISVFEHINAQTEAEQCASFKLLIEEEPSIVLEYNSLRALLKSILSAPSTVDDATLSYLVNRAMDCARILTKKYDVYINEHPSFLTKSALQKHQESYTRWLTLSHTIQKETKKKSRLDSLMDEFTTDRMNPRRLYLLRERRLLILLIPVIKDLGHYSSWIIWADAYVGPFLTYFNLLFFLPRLAFNAYTLCNNAFDQSKMSPESKKLGPLTRFLAQWNRLWPQLMNDIGWATNAILMCFVFVGSWGPFGIYLSVGMQFYDVIMASVRAGLDLTRLNNLAAQYKSLSLESGVMNSKDCDLFSLYLLHLETAISREKSLLYLALVNAAVLFVAVCLTLPVMAAISPWLPIVGAIIAIIMTVINFQGRSYLNTPESQTLENLLEKDQLNRITVNEAVDEVVNEAVDEVVNEAVDEVVNELVNEAKLNSQSNESFSFGLNLQSESSPSRQTALLRHRGHSSGNASQFFSSNTLPRSHSDTELKQRSPVSSSPTGVTVSHSLDDLDAYMMGGAVLG